jgi:hypothetical protein
MCSVYVFEFFVNICPFHPVKKFVAEFVQSLLGKQKQNEKYLYCKVELRWMRSSLVVKASDCQCLSRISSGFDPSWNLRGAADEAVFNSVHRKKK